ncbi:MAG: response regulator [Elusimicrobiales bacterium]|jgi:two-component system chemotaxis response regulator CheY
MKVLIVEDNDLTRYTIKSLLLKLGHEVVGEVGDAESAVKAYVSLKPEVVFLDLVLPGKSGVETLKEIREIDPGARVVVITAVEQEEIDRGLSDKGVSAIIRKPFSYEEFKAAVGDLAV